MGESIPGVAARDWSVDQLRVLAALFFNASFSIGDDARDECRAIADCFGRTPSSIDRQWRNMAAVVKGNTTYNVGALVKRAVSDYLADPAGSKALALAICRQYAWPLETIISQGRQQPLSDLVPVGLHAEIRIGLRRLCDHLEYRVFNSGSQGAFRSGKLTLLDGTRYQAQVTAVLVGSKGDLTVSMKATHEELSYAVSCILDALEAKTFKTGRVGFYGSGKVAVGAERYQVGVQAVRIGGA